jgi:hypothetical protein
MRERWMREEKVRSRLGKAETLKASPENAEALWLPVEYPAGYYVPP